MHPQPVGIHPVCPGDLRSGGRKGTPEGPGCGQGEGHSPAQLGLRGQEGILTAALQLRTLPGRVYFFSAG